MNMPIRIHFCFGHKLPSNSSGLKRMQKLKPTERFGLIWFPLSAVSALCGAMASTVGQHASCLHECQLITDSIHGVVWKRD